MGYTGKTESEFFMGIFAPWAFAEPEGKAAGEAMRKRRNVHRASLT
jgi:hypothetical protein